MDFISKHLNNKKKKKSGKKEEMGRAEWEANSAWSGLGTMSFAFKADKRKTKVINSESNK